MTEQTVSNQKGSISPSAKKMGKKQMNDTSRRVLRIAWTVFFTCAMLLILYLVTVEGYQYGKALFTENAVSRNAVTVEIEVSEGQSALQVGKKLEQAGVIGSGMVFAGKALLFQYEIAPGIYQVSPSMTDRQILEEMEE